MYEFDGENISKDDMRMIAKHVEAYLELLLDVFIIPDDMKVSEDDIYKSIKVTKKFIKKLREGNTSPFKNPEDWNIISE